MDKYIECNHDHWQLKGELRDLLMECRAVEESTRYAVTGIHAEKNDLVATDGHRIVIVQRQHKIKMGVYFCTEDGFLLALSEDDTFPKYKDIIPAKETLNEIVNVEGQGIDLTSLILGRLITAGCIVRLSLYRRPVELLEQVIDGRVNVFVAQTETASRPFMIEAETSVGFVRYIQMPVHVKNEVDLTTK